jgi:two-component system, LytTR family, response regulator
MRILIADDEPIAREILRDLLAEIGGVELAGEAASGVEAVDQIDRLRPDLVLLDLEMPGLDGFGVARLLRGERLPLIIFVTAYHQHALAAFEADAIDYLLKPVRRERMQAALAKAQAQLAGLAAAAPPTVRPEVPRRIAGVSGGEIHLLDPGDVIALLSEGELVHLVTASRRYLAQRTLKYFETTLEAPRFRRVRRGAMVNTDHIRRVSPLSSKRWLLKMSNGMDVIVSKRLASAIRQDLRW